MSSSRLICREKTNKISNLLKCKKEKFKDDLPEQVEWEITGNKTGDKH